MNRDKQSNPITATVMLTWPPVTEDDLPGSISRWLARCGYQDDTTLSLSFSPCDKVTVVIQQDTLMVVFVATWQGITAAPAMRMAKIPRRHEDLPKLVLELINDAAAEAIPSLGRVMELNPAGSPGEVDIITAPTRRIAGR